MGLLINGIWHDQWYDTAATKGEFVRTEAQFRDAISPAVDAQYPAQAGRYHLYVSLACPWAHRTLIMRALKGLEEMISVSVVHPLMLENGWEFRDDFPAATGDTVEGHPFVYELYRQHAPDYSGRVTVPILWDKHTQRIVNNESSEIIRMFNSAFDDIGAKTGDYYPQALRSAIDDVNAWVYAQVNNGVYRAGFATTQAAYDEAVTQLFAGLDRAEALLSQQRYLTGSQFTEADIRLFTTLVRFDPVYVSHFKCDQKRIADYPALAGFLREVYQMPGVAHTVNMAHIRHHYFCSHRTINPHSIIPVGPEFDLTAPHGRETL